MRKTSYLVLIIFSLSIFLACGRGDQGVDREEVLVFAAASMTEGLDRVKDAYEGANPDIVITYSFDSSGSLKTQIQEGADCHIFISAASRQMDQLDPTSGAYEGRTPIDPASRVDLLGNQVVLALGRGVEKEIGSFEDLAREDIDPIGLGNSDVPVGQYSEEILKKLGIWDQLGSRVSFGSNVKELTSWLDQGVVDCGIIYRTDARAAGLEILDQYDSSLLERPVVYPMALLHSAGDNAAARDFLDYLEGEEAREIFRDQGFVPLEG